MFKKLRNKFLLMYCGTFVVLMVLFFVILQTFAYGDMQRAADYAIDEIERASSAYTEELPTQDRFWTYLPPVPNIELFYHPLPATGLLNKLSPEQLKNGELSNFPKYVILKINEQQEIINTKSTANFSDEDYQLMKQTALESQEFTGNFKYDGDYFKYRIVDNRIIFLDISKEIELLKRMVGMFIWIVVPMLIMIFLASYYFANRAIKPLEVAFDKQKIFIADASHELKTPLTGILASVDLLLSNADECQEKWLRQIKTEAERMSNLTTRLLYLTKMDYKNIDHNLEKIDLAKIVEKYLLPYEAVFFEKQISTEIVLAPQLSIQAVREDIDKLIGVLVDNAIKYSVSKIKITLGKNNNYAELIVENDGVGILPEELKQIWDRFYRGDKSRSSTGGFGLGLSIAKSIVENYRGKIRVESTVDEYTKFIVQLPLA